MLRVLFTTTPVSETIAADASQPFRYAFRSAEHGGPGEAGNKRHAWSTATRLNLVAAIAMLLAFHVAMHASDRFGFADFLLVPIRVHLLTARELPEVETTLTRDDIERILVKMNGVWSQAGITLYLESIIREEALNQENYRQYGPFANRAALLGLRPVETQSDGMFHLYYVKRMSVNGIHFPEANFIKDTASLRAVEGGIDEPLPRVSSHELGHAFTLPHLQNTTNLMASGTTGTRLNGEEISRVREAAKKLDWIESASVVLSRAEELFRAGQPDESKRLFGRLALMPIRCQETERARAHFEETSGVSAGK